MQITLQTLKEKVVCKRKKKGGERKGGRKRKREFLSRKGSSEGRKLRIQAPICKVDFRKEKEQLFYEMGGEQKFPNCHRGDSTSLKHNLSMIALSNKRAPEEKNTTL